MVSGMSEAAKGFKAAGTLLLGLVTIGLLMGGIASISQATGISRPWGWAMVATGVLIVIITLERWASVLPALLIIAAINGFFMSISGHLLLNKDIAISRGQALTTSLILLASALTAFYLQTNKLNAVGKIAFLGVIGSFLWAFFKSSAHPLPFSVGLALLIVATLQKHFHFK